ncbi:PQQ-dependent sugar dehydrogenase [Oceanicoccus sp. KOV_DT_Chl]|uniref:PQQ-dependent sugar dehydrogenase n=1 Tax=Oceanicoccus sp. KOV_DT_Chl TaxID=1904639 RepID=UPI000C7A4FBD|nr:PQQ-dependent sugar dehydrogenase [Oceanicoccus sp. KOV_DT_Chl]
MKTFFKRVLMVLLLLIVLVAAAPFMFIQFGSDAAATSAKMLLNAIVGYGVASPQASEVEQRFNVPAGFQLSIYAGDLGKIRFMQISQQGDLIISRPRSGDIVLLKRDANQDGRPDGETVLLKDLVKPHGLALTDNWLYVAESTAVGKIAFDQQTGTVSGEYMRIAEGFSDSGNHWTKSIGIGPDGWLYLTSGSSCNVCEEEDEQRATMMRMKTDGSDVQIIATGLRNSVGLDWAPWDGALYATDNGRDLLGDDFPPCELNKIEIGGFYGWPYINGDGQLDPDLGPGKDALLDTAISPAHDFRAHNAPLGITFLKHSSRPDFQRTALVALHGSWNRSERDGYKVVALHWQQDGSIVEEDFLTGFKGETDVIGRPADVVEASNGDIYISDDYSGTVYRVALAGAGTEPAALATPVAETVVAVDPQQMLARYSDAELAALRQQGQEIYLQYRCANCHDPERATAMRTIKPLQGLAQRYTLDELADFFVTPTPPMPVYPLNSDQRKALAALLYSQ